MQLRPFRFGTDVSRFADPCLLYAGGSRACASERKNPSDFCTDWHVSRKAISITPLFPVHIHGGQGGRVGTISRDLEKSEQRYLIQIQIRKYGFPLPHFFIFFLFFFSVSPCKAIKWLKKNKNGPICHLFWKFYRYGTVYFSGFKWWISFAK